MVLSTCFPRDQIEQITCHVVDGDPSFLSFPLVSFLSFRSERCVSGEGVLGRGGCKRKREKEKTTDEGMESGEESGGKMMGRAGEWVGAKAMGHDEGPRGGDVAWHGDELGVVTVRVEAVEGLDAIRRAIGRAGRAPIHPFVELGVGDWTAGARKGKARYRTYTAHGGFKDAAVRFAEPAGATFRLPVDSRETLVHVAIGEGEGARRMLTTGMEAMTFSGSFPVSVAVDAAGGGPVPIVTAGGHVRLSVKFEPSPAWVSWQVAASKKLVGLRVAGSRGGLGLALRPPFTPSVYEYRVVVPRLRPPPPEAQGSGAQGDKSLVSPVEDGADQCFVTATTASGPAHGFITVNGRRWASGQEVACPMGATSICLDGADKEYRLTAARPEPLLASPEVGIDAPKAVLDAPPAEEAADIAQEKGGNRVRENRRGQGGRGIGRWLSRHPTLVQVFTAVGLGVGLWYL